MTDLKLWGTTIVIAWGVVACGETSDFVGNAPGGTAGTASGGTASGGSKSDGGSTSHAGTSSNGGTSSGGTSASAGTGMGGDTTSAGTGIGGSIEHGGTGSGGGDPTGCAQISGNWTKCDDGLVHRTAPGTCASKLPRAAAIAVTKPDLDECTKDSECTAKPNGYCEVLQGGFLPVEPHNICAYGCLRDADCGDAEVCQCGDFIGTCQSAGSCKSDQDCQGGALCTQYDSCPGVPTTLFACQSAQDKCATNADCTNAMLRYCSLGADGRSCVGVRCAAVAGGP